MRVIIIILFLGIFLGPYFFLLNEKLHLIRVLPIIIIGITLASKIQLSRSSTFFILFYILYIGYTFYISSIHLEYIVINDIINLVVLLLYVIATIMLINYDKSLFIAGIKKTGWVFVFVSIGVMVYELTTWKHLWLSGMANVLRPDYTYFHLPTTFYTNPNDFAFVFVLVSMFLLFREKRNWVIYLLILLTMAVIYFTEARLAFIAFSVYLIFYFNFFRLRTIGLILLLIIGVALMLQLTNEFDESRLLSFDMSKGGSLFRRYHLYVEGLKSIFYNYGTGFGVGGYHHYYSNVVTSLDISSDTDPHNYFIELLINSGIYITVLYCALQIGIFIGMIRLRAHRLILIQFILYNVLLLSSSSSLFLWPHYLFYFLYVYYPRNDEG